MKISELIYQIRDVARHETDMSRKAMFHDCAKAMEAMHQIVKVSDFLAAIQQKEAVYFDTAKFHLDTLQKHGFISEDDRYPYGNENLDIIRDSQAVNDISTE